MIFQLLSIANEIKDHQVHPLLRRILNGLFVSGITSFLFKKYYFNYEIIDLSDYKGYYHFFINGDFIIPFGIFFLVWGLTWFFKILFFSLPNVILTTRLKRSILKFSFSKTLSDSNFDKRSTKPEQLNDPLIELLGRIKASIPTFESKHIRRSIEKTKDNIEENFLVLIRGFVAIIIYFISISHFGWILFLILSSAIFLIGVLLFLGYQLIETIPFLLVKTSEEIGEYITHVKEERLQ